MTDAEHKSAQAEYERREAICTARAMEQWTNSLKRQDLDDESRVRGAIEAYKRQAFALTMVDGALADPARSSERPEVKVQKMRLSGERADYYVSIKVGDRHVHPHVFREEYKAAYHVALYHWLLNGGDGEPDLMDFDENDWPAQKTVLVGADASEIERLEKLLAEAVRERDEALDLPWPDWAESILANLKRGGYNPSDENGDIDLAEAVSEHLSALASDAERLREKMKAAVAEIERLRAAVVSAAVTIKPLVWDDYPTGEFSEATAAGRVYETDDDDDGRPLSEKKLEAEGRYITDITSLLVPVVESGIQALTLEGAVHAHAVRKAASREEHRGEAGFAVELRDAMRFIESAAERELGLARKAEG